MINEIHQIDDEDVTQNMSREYVSQLSLMHNNIMEYIHHIIIHILDDISNHHHEIHIKSVHHISMFVTLSVSHP